MNSDLVLREFLGGPLDGQLVETHGSPPAFCEALGDDGSSDTYVLTDWQLPVATYQWRQPDAA